MCNIIIHVLNVRFNGKQCASNLWIVFYPNYFMNIKYVSLTSQPLALLFDNVAC